MDSLCQGIVLERFPYGRKACGYHGMWGRITDW